MSSEPCVFPVAPLPSSAYWFTASIVAALTVLPMLVLLVPFGPGRTEIEVDREALRIHGSVYGRTIAHASGVARRLTAAELRDHAPSVRTNGVGLPSYQAGWFRLKNRASALLFVTDWSKAVLVPTSEDFSLIVSPEDPDGFLSALARWQVPAQALPDVAPLRFPLAPPRTSLRDLLPFLGAMSIAPVLVGGILGFLIRAARRIRFEVSEQGLNFVGLYGRKIARDAIDPAHCRIVDLKTDPSCRPRLRTNGIGMPGYLSGWFRLQNKERALLFVTDRSRSVVIPTTLGFTVVVSPEDPEGFLSALQTRMGAPS